MSKDEIAIDISTILYELYNKLNNNKENDEKIYFSPSIKDVSILKNCTPDTVEMLKKIISERDSIVKYVLSTSVVKGIDVEEEYNNKNKITVIISDEDIITLKYQYEFVEEKFNETLQIIKKYLSEQTDKIVKEELIKRDKPIREQLYFGILGNYQLNYINYYDEEGYTREQINKKIKNIMKKFKENIDSINNKIFMKIYNIDLLGEPIWEEDFFEQIINQDKLPDNFNDLSEEEKSDVLYEISKLDEKDFENISNNNLKLFNFKEIEKTAKIYNVTIEPEYKKMSIEFHFLNEYMSPMIVLNYNKDFEIQDYESGY